ncbi:hypothetical protein LMG24238_07109 [Paraburkholderia sediminicola]|uniref:Uncharacterized protein n=1 Tax=Paraburkholderia sediminicola TaxID=458836 RepID=A0A6J5CTA0_9BURK|nr:hypothetical protein LMG24238_07109 [Paraburkholderia sediminicola]
MPPNSETSSAIAGLAPAASAVSLPAKLPSASPSNCVPFCELIVQPLTVAFTSVARDSRLTCPAPTFRPSPLISIVAGVARFVSTLKASGLSARGLKLAAASVSTGALMVVAPFTEMPAALAISRCAGAPATSIAPFSLDACAELTSATITLAAVPFRFALAAS